MLHKCRIARQKKYVEKAETWDTAFMAKTVERLLFLPISVASYMRLKMSRRNKLLAKHQRARLLVTLGNQCARCQDTRDLTFDCIKSQGHRHHSMDASARMCFYHRQHEAQNLQILCRRCNGVKGHAERQAHEQQLAEMPF